VTANDGEDMSPAREGKAPGGRVRTPTDASYLRDLFNNSARYYESVNKVTSLGQVVIWRKEVVWAASLHPVDRVLDAFSGPGGLAAEAVGHLGCAGKLVLGDLSPVMLHEARKRLGPILASRGSDRPRVEYVAGDLLRDDLGLRDFDVVLLGWGLRYVADVGAALARMRSFLDLGGRLVVLEFTRPPRASWATPAHLYFRYLLPEIGSWLAGDRELHEYLSESAATFLTKEELIQAVEGAGFALSSCSSHLDGLVTIVAADAS
jgi:demethylmenaquinone methyltransferase / 2-methoxy-6-polyprenyl-1,4-benzoquinol methylase